MPGAATTRLHASCVCLSGQGVLIRGASGSGKSTLALQLLALGAELVADDQTVITAKGDALIATAPKAIQGMIEARGVGLLAADPAPSAIVRLVVDLDQLEGERLPPFRTTRILGHEVTLLHRVDHGHFPAAILQYLKGGRRA